MKYKHLLLIITMNLILFISCKKESNPLTVTSNIFYTQENSVNHLKLAIASSKSKIEHSETLNFTTDSVLVNLEIVDFKEGTGDIHLFTDEYTTITAFYFNRDTIITDMILLYKPNKATITLKNFTGFFKYEMEGL